MRTPRHAQPLYNSAPKPKQLTPLEAAINDLPNGNIKAGLDWFNRTSPLGKIAGIVAAGFFIKVLVDRYSK